MEAIIVSERQQFGRNIRVRLYSYATRIKSMLYRIALLATVLVIEFLTLLIFLVIGISRTIQNGSWLR